MKKYYTNAHRSGNFIFVREVRDGKRRKFKTEYQPTLYLPNKAISTFLRATGKQNTNFKAPDGTSVGPVKPGSLFDCYKFTQKYKGLQEVYGNTAYEYAFLNEEYPGHIDYNIADMVVLNLDIEVASKGGFSTAEAADQEVTAITIKNSKDGIFHVFACKEFKNNLSEVRYYQCDDELDLLDRFLTLWETIEPDIVTGWNVRLYDMPYLINRINKVMDSDNAVRLSPWKEIKESTVNIFNKPHVVYDVAGVSILDYLLIYRKNVLEPRENYRLDYIAQVELGESKVDYGEYGSLQALYEQNFQKFMEYNIHDVRLVDRIDAKRKLIELQLIVAYDAKVNFVDVLSQVRVWDMKIINHLLENGVVVPQKETVEKDTQFIGAFVMKPKPGLFEWVVSFDVTSLYPTIMRTLNIGIESKLTEKELTEAMKGYLEYVTNNLIMEVVDDKDGKSGAGTKIVNLDTILNGMTDEHIKAFTDSDVTVGANGVFYRREPKSFYSVLIEDLFNKRIEYRNKAKKATEELENVVDPKQILELKEIISIFDLKQKATKIQLNSLYGACGNQYFRFFDVKNAEAVTTTGQFIIQFIGRGLEVYLNNVMKTTGQKFLVYSDTDSVYLSLVSLVNKFSPDVDVMQKCAFVDNVCKKAIQPEIDRLFRVITNRYLNGCGNYLKMALEVIGDKAIWTAKKRYIINVRDKDGIRKEKPELKIMGIEIAKSTIPKFCRDAMKEAVTIVMEGDQEKLFKFIADTKGKFLAQALEDVAFPRSVNGIKKYGDDETIYTKGTPIHTKGALIYNHLVKQNNLQDKYPLIRDGEKIRYIHMREPNPIANAAMAFPVSLPAEFGLDKYINWEMQWEKSMIEPLMLILNCINWDTQKRASLDSLFDDDEPVSTWEPPVEDDEEDEEAVMIDEEI